jgi:ABC-2 type transport system permease protein
MNKLWLIIKREYLVRVRKKSFLIVTILAPLAFATITFGMGFLTAYMTRNSTKQILVKDDSGIFKKYYKQKGGNVYTFTSGKINELKRIYHKKGYDMLAYIPAYNDDLENLKVKYYSPKKPGLSTLGKVESDISKSFKEYKIEKSNLDRQILDKLYVDVSLENAEAIDSQGDKTGKVSLIISTALAFVMGFLLYMVIFIFGTQVMRSVMEEKINRIVEIIISSVKPFELMLGKVIGVGAVGLTQLFIWIIFIPVILSLAGMFFGQVPQNGGSMMGMESQINPEDLKQFPINMVIHEFFSLNWGLILPAFILFFLGGYFMYSSLFAAVGTAIGDDQGESQSLIWPITVPVVFAMIIMFNSVENPDSQLAVFGSIFPLFSPIVMPARLPFDPPIWQVGLSLVLLILTCILFIWISAKIYRTGILMYGKKLTVKDMIKMTFSRN